MLMKQLNRIPLEDNQKGRPEDRPLHAVIHKDYFPTLTLMVLPFTRTR